MSRKSVIPVMLVVTLALFACNLTGTATPAAVPTGTIGIPTATTAAPTDTAASVPTATLPPATASLAPSATPVPAAANTVAPVPNPASGNYIDDRSTPSQVIVSLYNAINRQEYLRAYSYWNDPATSLGSFTAYANGYQNTASVDLVFGQITGDAGMSQVYYTVPVILKATAMNGTHTNYAACYIVHEANAGCLWRAAVRTDGDQPGGQPK